MGHLDRKIHSLRTRLKLNQGPFGALVEASQTTVSRWESGKQAPGTAHLSQLADLAGETVESFSNGENHSPGMRGAVPVIDRITAGGWSEIVDPYPPGAADEYLTPEVPVSAHAFGLVIDGNSMEPEFKTGDKVIIDPAIPPRPSDYVVAKREMDEEATFKKYRLRGQDDRGNDIIELAPLNLDFPTIMMDEKNPGHIVGVMVEHRRYRRQ